MATEVEQVPDNPAMVRRNDLGGILRRTAGRVPDKVALEDAGVTFTFAELDTAVDRVANAMLEQEIRPGERVAIYAYNSYYVILLDLALFRIGAVSVPLNFMLREQEVAYILEDSGAVALCAGRDLLDTAAAAVAMVRERDPDLVSTCVAIDHGGEPWASRTLPAGWSSVGEWIEHGSAKEPPSPAQAGDLAQLMYTSGTESRPKGVMLTHAALISQYASCIIEGEMSSDDIEIHALPLYHCAQLHCFLMPDLYLGATSSILSGADPGRLLEEVRRTGATKLFAPPTVWIDLLNHPDFDRLRPVTLRKGYYGASAMPAAVLERLAMELPRLRLWNFYGQTEMGPLAAVLKPEDAARRLGSAGRPTLNVQTRIVDGAGRTVPAGTVGEIVHRSPQAMLGYWNDPAKTAEAFRGGWLHSGDLGVLDDDGFLTIVDRKKDMVNSGGENVSSREVEEVIYRMAGVAEVAVIGVPDPRWIEAVTAIVVRTPGAETTPEEIQGFCRSLLAPYKVPKAVRFAEALPKNASGKVLKRSIRELYQGPTASKAGT